MNKLRSLMIIVGTILLMYSVLAGLLLFLEVFGVEIGSFVTYFGRSRVDYGPFYPFNEQYPFKIIPYNVSAGGASNVPIFLGICAATGAYLLVSAKKEFK